MLLTMNIMMSASKNSVSLGFYYCCHKAAKSYCCLNPATTLNLCIHSGKVVFVHVNTPNASSLCWTCCCVPPAIQFPSTLWSCLQPWSHTQLLALSLFSPSPASLPQVSFSLSLSLSLYFYFFLFLPSSFSHSQPHISLLHHCTNLPLLSSHSCLPLSCPFAPLSPPRAASFFWFSSLHSAL